MMQSTKVERLANELKMLSRVCAEACRVLSKKLPDLVQKSGIENILAESENVAERYINSEEGDYITVALAGEFSSGKSTLINALLEDEILPSGDLPLTSINVQIQHSDRAYIRITWNKELSLNGRRLFLVKYAYWLRSWSQFNLISPQCELVCDSVKVSKIRDFLRKLEADRKSTSVYAADAIEIGIPFPEQWRQVRFLDVPGSGAISSVQKQIQDSYKNQYLLLYVIDAQRIGSRLTEELIQQYSQLGAQLLVVINKWDTIPRKEQQAKLEEAEECYGVKVVPFAGLSYLFSRLVATKRYKVKDVIREGKLNLAVPMNSPSWNAKNVEQNAGDLADFLQERSNYIHFSNELKNCLSEYSVRNINRYKERLQTFIKANEERQASLKEEIKNKSAEKANLERIQKEEHTRCVLVETVCKSSEEEYRSNFEKEFQNSIKSVKIHLRERAKAFAEDELKKNAQGNWNVISINDYIDHCSWDDAGTILLFYSKLYKVNKLSIGNLNTRFSALDKSIPKLYPKLDTRQLELDLKKIITYQKYKFFKSLYDIASDRNGYPDFFAKFFTNAMHDYIHKKRNRFHSEIDSISRHAFNVLSPSSFIESYKEILSPIHQFIARRRCDEQKRQQRINALQSEIDAAGDELNTIGSAMNMPLP